MSDVNETGPRPVPFALYDSLRLPAGVAPPEWLPGGLGWQHYVRLPMFARASILRPASLLVSRLAFFLSGAPLDVAAIRENLTFCFQVGGKTWLQSWASSLVVEGVFEPYLLDKAGRRNELTLPVPAFPTPLLLNASLFFSVECLLRLLEGFRLTEDLGMCCVLDGLADLGQSGEDYGSESVPDLSVFDKRTGNGGPTIRGRGAK